VTIHRRSLSTCHRATGCRVFRNMSFQCFTSIGPLLAPKTTRPMSSLRPNLSLSMTLTASDACRTRSYGNRNMKSSLNVGLRVRSETGVLRFSVFLPSINSQIFTYGSAHKHSCWATTMTFAFKLVNECSVKCKM